LTGIGEQISAVPATGAVLDLHLPPWVPVAPPVPVGVVPQPYLQDFMSNSGANCPHYKAAGGLNVTG